MKAYLFFLLQFTCAMQIHSQQMPAALRELPLTVKVDKNTLQHYLEQLQRMTPGESDAMRSLGDWLIARTEDDSLRDLQAAANFALGKMYTNMLNFGEASRYLTTALAIADKNALYTIQAQALNALGSINNRNEQKAKAVEYFEESLSISRQHNYLRGMALSQYNLGGALLDIKPYRPEQARYAINLMFQGFELVTQLKDTQSIINQSAGLAAAYARFKKYDAALQVLSVAENLIIATGSSFAYINHYNQVAKIFQEQKKYQDAIKYYDAGLAQARKYNVPRWLCMYYSGLADTYQNLGDYKKANQYNLLNIQMHDALVTKENFAAAADIQNKYERTRKDNEILKLAAANKQKSTLNLILFGSTASLLVIGILGLLNFKSRTRIARQQEEIQLQKIKELEKDKQLVSIDAMLKGQEEERSRIAKDLHDGLGGLLSGTKLSFINVKENLSLSPVDARLFDKSLRMLDNTIGDLRKVAHNLMPEALVKFGLQDALRDFCDSIQTSHALKIIYQQFGEKRILDNTAQIFTYRIVQELVNNAVKHAGATEIFVQLAIGHECTCVTVEDNGHGFDTATLANTKGAGMSNIHYRVQYFNGTADIVSSPGCGTAVNIELKA